MTENADTKKQIAIAIVHASALGIGAVLNNFKSESKRTDFIRAYVDAVRFFSDKSGYFFVYKYDCLNIALPNPKANEGKNLHDYKDSKGKYVIRELSATAKKGGGFVEYYWLKPGLKTEQKKLGYVEPIPGSEYFIGTGIYGIK